jgi:hypothetical protein
MSTKTKLAELILAAMCAEAAGPVSDADAANILADGLALFAQLVGEAAVVAQVTAEVTAGESSIECLRSIAESLERLVRQGEYVPWFGEGGPASSTKD